MANMRPVRFKNRPIAFTEYRVTGTTRQGNLNWVVIRWSLVMVTTGNREYALGEEPIAKALHHVIVHHSHRLHEGVTDH